MADNTILLAADYAALGGMVGTLLPLVLGIGLVIAGIKRRKQSSQNPNRASGTTLIVVGALLLGFSLLSIAGRA